MAKLGRQDMAKLAFTLALLMWASLAAETQADERSGPDNRQILSREVHLACGKSHISLLSGFRVENIEANELQAVFQVLTVQSASGRAKTFFMEYQPPKDGDDSMVVSVDCLKNSNTKKFFVALDSTNFGNCSSCEWTDLFSEDGEVVSLAKTPFGPVNIDRRHFIQKATGDHDDARDQVVDSINISRAIQERHRQ